MEENGKKRKNLWMAMLESRVIDKSEITKKSNIISFLTDTRNCPVKKDNPFLKIVNAAPDCKFRLMLDPNNELIPNLAEKENMVFFLPFPKFKQELEVSDFENTGNLEESFKVVRWLADDTYGKIPGVVRALQACMVNIILGTDYKTAPKLVLVNTKEDLTKKLGDIYKNLGTLYRPLLLCEKLDISFISIYDKDLENKLKQFNVIGEDVKLDSTPVVETTKEDVDDIINNLKEESNIEVSEDDITF